MLALIMLGLSFGYVWLQSSQNDAPQQAHAEAEMRQNQLALANQSIANEGADGLPFGFVLPENGPQPSPLKASQNRQLVTQLYEDVFATGDTTLLDQLIADNLHYYLVDETVVTLNASDFARYVTLRSPKFSTMHYQTEAILVAGDHIIVHWRVNSDQTASPETQEIWTGITLWQIVDEKLVAGWTIDLSDAS